jgi:glycosyltransferase involved in cell wall biosynthesis
MNQAHTLPVKRIQADPLISVIIPVYNGERYLAEAIASVLAQTYPPGEIIVLDDGSTDGSAKLVERYSPAVHYYWQPNSGAGAARNRGVELAHGNFLAFLDADDLWIEDKLARQCSAFTSDPTLEVVFGHVQQFYSPELDEETKRHITIPIETMRGFHVGAMLIKRETFFRVGLFKTDLQLAELVDWHARAMELGLRSLMLPDVVMKRRIHQTNQGIRQRAARRDYVRVLKASLDRRRKQEKS